MNRTQLKAGFEVAWCSEMPELDGEPDIDRATYCHRDFATIAEAHAFATKVVPWRACVSVDGRWASLGFFATKEDAIAARLAGASSAYGEFMRQPEPPPAESRSSE